MNDVEEIIQAIYIGLVLATFLYMTCRARKAIELCKESLVLLNNKALEKENQLAKFFYEAIYKVLFVAYLRIRDYTNAVAYGRKLLAIKREGRETVQEGILCIKLAAICQDQNKYFEAKKLYERAISIMNKTGNRKYEGHACAELGTVLYFLSDFAKSVEYVEKALAIAIEIGDRKGEGSSYENLGIVHISLGDYVKAKEYFEKALAISVEIDDRKAEGTCYQSLGTVFDSLGDYVKVNEYLEKALAIAIEIGDREGEGTCYQSLGTVFDSLGDYVKAKEYLEKALAIAIEIGDREGEGTCYQSLGTVFDSLGDYVKAKEYLEKALAIANEIGDRKGEGSCSRNLGTVLDSLGDYVKAKEYLEKALAIAIETGDRKGEGSCYQNIGTAFKSVGDYVKANEYYEEALAIAIEIGDRKEEGTCYQSLGTVFDSLGDYVKAKEYLEKALAIAIEIGDRKGEANSCLSLGHVLLCLRIKHANAGKYLEKALLIATEASDRKCEALCYDLLGQLFQSLCNYVKAKEYYEKALDISVEIGHRTGEASIYVNLGSLCINLNEYVKAEEYLEKALSIVKKGVQNVRLEIFCFENIAKAKIAQDKKQEAFPYLFQAIKKCEERRGFLKDNDDFRVLYSDQYNSPYKTLSLLFCTAGNPKKALYVEELGRARALSDLMAAQYSVERQISADPQSWTGIEDVSNLESDSVCLYISYDAQNVLLWILKAGGVVEFQESTVEKKILSTKQATHLDNFFNNVAESFRGNPESYKDSTRQNLTLLYKMIIAPVAKLLKESEIIIVPDRHLYHVPFPAILDDSGKYLSETFRIRIVPSLTTLKCIQDSPVASNCQTGALIVGDPEVGEVVWKGWRKTISPLPFARKEAEMIGRLLGVQPLIGQQATKQAVLQRINSVSLIHFAAHGNEDKGEIILVPVRTGRRLPRETDCLLAVGDILQVQLRAKLVVLSCGHSGRGQIKVEGVVGMARAFLGSGARSVLVSLSALEDEATEQLMSRFYEHLYRGVSASESLHQAMRWMRDNGFAKVSEWAPFMLIGDNVTFDFGNKKSDELNNGCLQADIKAALT